jgi:AcrR family transcriptional regulator
MDRRVRRTRHALRAALLSLVAEKGYDHITVQDILERADLGRATFYAHFRDKEDLLVSGFEELRESVRAAMHAYAERGIEPVAEDMTHARALFEHVGGHHQLYHALVSSRGGGAMLRYARAELTSLACEHFEAVAHERGTEPRVPLPVLAEYVSGALIGVLTWWLDADMPYPAEEMAALFERVTTPALEAALGLSY